ncbi:MAG: tetratricopeptide repeat protein [Ignavibacteriales bacterium]|nr:MAG: tetratricopeptide repeat protein [Ignavibacteriaceae bacterium]MBW7873885.1 tetratricopeptide repeat protein [Ignavibacteria bacterium]MCZ2143356.1 tetratricopeptide repeat protein [Ignavibacteriales bacterium]OQY78119.1 MAG: hypothetical protein B6D45_02405 [Ignavibacteriales bacterium UTCHB3]MBV6444237.1 Beta-barrel assembly-enhancing protease [Ignavibacteriaceae bacterium]
MNTSVSKQILPFFAIFSLFFSTAVAQPGYSDNKLLLAQQFEQLNQFEKAKTIYLDLHQKSPGDYFFLESLVRVTNKLRNYDESLGYLNLWNNNHPRDVNGINLQGKTLLLAGKEKDALKLWDDFLETVNYDPNLSRVLAFSAIDAKAFDSAIYLLEKAKKKTGKPIYFLLDLGYLYGYTMQYDKAAGAYSELLELDPQQFPQIDSRIRSTANNPEAALEFIKAFENFVEPSPQTLRILFSLYLDQKMFAKAINTALLLEKTGNENGVSLYRAAEEAFYGGDFASAAGAYAKLLELYPNRPDKPVVNLNFVKAMDETLNLRYIELNPVWKPYDLEIMPPREDYQPVLDKYSEIISLFKNSETASEAIFRKGYLHYKLKEYEEALGLFNELITNRPHSQFAANAWLYKGLIELRKNKNQEAENCFKSASTAFSTNPDVQNRARYYLMLCYFFRGETEHTQELLTQIIANPADNLANDALELAPILNKNFADSLTSLVFAKGEKLLLQGNLKEAFTVFNELRSSTSKIAAWMALYKSAEIAASLDESDTAIELLNEAVSDPMNLFADKSLFLLGDIYLFSKKDTQSAVKAYEQILIQFPKSILFDKARETILSLKNN